MASKATNQQLGEGGKVIVYGHLFIDGGVIVVSDRISRFFLFLLL